ncbi:MAG TPA: TadE/TadG family type IV pilus assembly protein [Ktedonobacterales bacterium]|nr:TadE/TadG family type IV pilus assembly protein [Ktedonobacterales bacterium]
MIERSTNEPPQASEKKALSNRPQLALMRSPAPAHNTLCYSRQGERGQTLVIIALLTTILIGILGLAVDVGYAYSERRQIQNAADASALNGAREMDAQISNGNQVGADNQVLLAIRQYITAYNLTVNASGNSPAFLQSAVYVNEAGSTTYGSVGATSSNQIPSGAAGVRVSVQEPWTPFLLEVLGVSSFSISASATAASGTIPGADTVFVNCPPYSGSKATENLTLSGGGGGNSDTINGSIFVNGSAKVSGGSITVSGTFGASGTITGNGIQAVGGISQNQPPQQFPLPDVAFPVDANGNPNSGIYNTGSGSAAYAPSAAYPEFDQEAFWDFYLGYDTSTLPNQGQAGNPPFPSGLYATGDYADLYFVVDIPPNLLGQVSLSSVLNQIPDVTQANYFQAYQGHYNAYFHQWVSQIYAASATPTLSYPWLHWVDVAGSSNPGDPTTWYSLTPTISLLGNVVFQAQTSQHPVNSFGGKCPTADCFPSGIWWALNWPTNTNSITMTNLNVAWTNPGTGIVLPNAGITFMTNIEFLYGNNSAAGAIYGWGYQATKHPAEQVYYYGWGALGTLYVPRTVLYTTFAPPLPSDCSSTTPAEGLHFNGSNQSINGFVMAPYGDITFRGSGTNNFNGELFAAQIQFSGSGVTLTFDTTSAVKGDPGLIQ